MTRKQLHHLLQLEDDSAQTEVTITRIDKYVDAEICRHLLPILTELGWKPKSGIPASCSWEKSELLHLCRTGIRELVSRLEIARREHRKQTQKISAQAQVLFDFFERGGKLL